MKKIIFSVAFATAVLASSFTYASENDPASKAKEAFSTEFGNAKNVEWLAMGKEGVYQAKFTFNNEPLQAFFTEDGDFLGTTRQITKAQLPILISARLQKEYPDANLITIFEYSKKDGLEYYITLTTTKGVSIIKAAGNGELSVYKKNFKE